MVLRYDGIFLWQHSCNSLEFLLGFLLGLSFLILLTLHEKVIRINLERMGFLEITEMERC